MLLLTQSSLSVVMSAQTAHQGGTSVTGAVGAVEAACAAAAACSPAPAAGAAAAWAEVLLVAPEGAAVAVQSEVALQAAWTACQQHAGEPRVPLGTAVLRQAQSC
jgi:hypothetical protein